MRSLTGKPAITAHAIAAALILALLPLAGVHASYRSAGVCGCAASPQARVSAAAFARWLSAPAVRVDSGGARAKVYVADELSGTVSVIDATSNQRVKAIEVSYDHDGMRMAFAPHNVQVAPDGKSVWVTAPMAMTTPDGGCTDDCAPVSGMNMSEEVVVIDPETDEIIARIALPSTSPERMLHLAHVVLDAESRYAFVTANYESLIIKIDAKTYQEVARWDLGRDRLPHGLRVCAGQLFVANMYGKGFGVVNTETGAMQEVPLGGVAVQTACTPRGKYAFASLYDTREVVRYDIAKKTVTRITLPEGAQGPIQLYVTPDEKTLYVADQGNLYGRPANNRVYQIDVATARVSRTIETGNGPHGVVIDNRGDRAYVTNLLSDDVAVLDVSTGEVLNKIQVGKSPNGIGYWFGTGGMP